MLAMSLLDAIIGDDWRINHFDAFPAHFSKRYKQQVKCKSYSRSRERVWAMLQVGELPGLCSGLFDDRIYKQGAAQVQAQKISFSSSLLIPIHVHDIV